MFEMYQHSPRLTYSDEENRIFQLGNGRKLHCTFSQTGLFPYVDMYTMEDEEIQFETRMPHLRIYASEFEKFRDTLMDFIKYMLWDHWDDDDSIKQPVMVGLNDPSRPNLIIDCSCSYSWLLVRSQSKKNVKNLERPECMRDKEIYFPVRLAFHEGDLWMLQDHVIKIISTFFIKAKEHRKMLLLEGRLSAPPHPMLKYRFSFSRRVDLHKPTRLLIPASKPSGATLF